MDRSAVPLPVAGAPQDPSECSVWVLVGGFLVIAVCGVVHDLRLVALIRVMASPPFLSRRDAAGTIRPSPSLVLPETRTWVGGNTVDSYRGHHRQMRSRRQLLHVARRFAVLVVLDVVPQECSQGRSHQAVGPGSAVRVEQEDLSFVYGAEMTSH